MKSVRAWASLAVLVNIFKKSERGGPGQLDSFQELGLPLRDLFGVDIEALGQLHQRLV